MEAPFDITSSVSLQPHSVCALTRDQLAALAGGTFGFAQIGNDMVLHNSGTVQNRTNLLDYGVRNYVAGATVTMCGPA